MSLLDSDEGDSRLVSPLEHHASLSHRPQFILENVEELSLRHSVSVHDDTGWLEASVTVELDEKLADHVREVCDDLLQERRLALVQVLIYPSVRNRETNAPVCAAVHSQ